MSALRLFAYLSAAVAVLTAIASVVSYVTVAPIAGIGVTVLLGAPLAFGVRIWGTLAAVLAGLLALLGGPVLAEYSWIANGEEGIGRQVDHLPRAHRRTDRDEHMAARRPDPSLRRVPGHQRERLHRRMDHPDQNVCARAPGRGGV